MKRFEVRRAFRRPIEVISASWDMPIGFLTGDLSPRGAYVLSDLMPDMGEHIVCSFNLGNDLEFDFFGEIVRVNMMRRKVDWGAPGFGIRFMDAGPKDRIKIRDVLRGTPPPIPTMRKVPQNGARIAHPARTGIKISPIIVV